MGHRFLSKKYWNMENPLGDTADAEICRADILNLSLGDPDLTTHDIIINSAFEDAKKGYTHYTNPEGYSDYIDEVIKYYNDEYNICIKKDEVMAVAGGCHGIFLTLQCILDDRDEVIIPNPSFPMYKNQVALGRGTAVFLETTEKENFNINIDKLNSIISNKTKAIIINTPNNPTGLCYNEENIRKIIALAIDKDIMIITDEVYDAFSFEKPFKPLLTFEEAKDRIITVGSFSKDFAMTGWRIGYVVAPNYIVNCMKNLNESICFSASSISQRAGIYALRHRKDIQGDIIDEYKNRVLYSYYRLKKIKGIYVLKPQGAIYLFINIKNTGLSSVDFAKKLLNEKQVQVIPGSIFGSGGEGYIRIACTLPIDKLKIAFDRIQEFAERKIK
ncbi:aminotransferase class I/II-fold pyridoxal phosphate-dependent enzyme [Clostridium sp. DJ247]|nr:aminotransferase class I/II-fold pyridoxal phosphate-dependent enzyme [Clostridium sp. DJ247]